VFFISYEKDEFPSDLQVDYTSTDMDSDIPSVISEADTVGSEKEQNNSGSKTVLSFFLLTSIALNLLLHNVLINCINNSYNT